VVRRREAPALSTIGYQGSVLPAVLAALREAGVARLIDVRAVPQSRKAGFSRRVLAASVEAAGMRYTHLRGLGTPKPGRDAVRHGDVDAMHRIFRAHMQTPTAQHDLAEAIGLARAEPCCLLCFERDHQDCHRLLIAEMVRAQTGQQVQHLLPEPV
jgi:uncharacterized protein (DUF488 family)